MSSRVELRTAPGVHAAAGLPQNGAHIPPKPPIQGHDRAGFLQAVVARSGWWDQLFSEGTTGGHGWDPARMEYGFQLAAETSTGEVVLSAPEYDGTRLDW